MESVDYDPAAVTKHLQRPGIAPALASLIEALTSTSAFDQQALEAVVRQTAEASSLKAAALIHATRVAIVGKAISPGLFEVMELLGQQRTISRLRAAQNILPG